MDKQRDFSIDVLRFLGMIFIIQCHVEPPTIVFNLRNFDVVMLVFASGLSFAAQNRNYLINGRSYFRYLVKRIKRLLLPTWVFLVVYFAFFNIVGTIFPEKMIAFGMEDYVLSFSLISGIGYVWVFRVYILMAVVSPFLYSLVKKWKDDARRLIVLCTMIAVQEILVFLIADKTSILFMLIKYSIGYMLGYGIVVFVAMIAHKAQDRYLVLCGGGYFTIFIVAFFMSGCPQLADYKYPPQLLYSSYGVGISLIALYCCRTFIKGRNGRVGKLVTWVSKNSLMIYYFHILLLSAKNYGLYTLPIDNWYIRLVFVCVVSSLLSWIYEKVKEVVIMKICIRN